MSHPTQGQLPISAELAEVLAPKILRNVPTQGDGCWIRVAYVDQGSGYTRIHHRQGKTHLATYYAHRVMYVLANGPIAEGLTVDHLCEQRACCNPAHLRAVAHRANVLRSRTNPYSINAAKEVCIRGHEFEQHPKNKRWRHCPECNRIRQRAYYARRRAGVAA